VDKIRIAKKKRLSAISVIMLLMTACAGSKLPPEVSPEVWELARNNPQLYISQLEGKRPLISSMAARYKIKMKVRENSYNFRQLALLKGPDFIRLEFSNSFGIAQALMIANDERIYFYLLKEKQYYSAPPTAESFFKLIGLRLEAQELKDILLNQYLSATIPQARTIQWDNKFDLIVMTQRDKDLQRKILYYISPKIEGILITRIIDLNNQQEILRAHYSNYRIEEGILFPREIFLKVPTEGIEITLKTKDVKFNLENIPLDSFQFYPHHNAIGKDLEELKGEGAILLKRIS